MRIAFFGLPVAALLLARDGHNIVYAGICRKDALGIRRLLRTVGKPRVDVAPRAGDALVEKVRESSPDLLVSWFWTKKLSPSLLALPRLGAIGVHPSLLPRHRGPDPYYWAIACGDEVTGVTAHMLREEYDTGAILGQKELAIDPKWNSWNLAKCLDRPSLALLRETVARFAGGNPPTGVFQDDACVTYAAAPTEDDLRIDWRKDTDSILRGIRAASPSPGAVTFFHDRPLAVLTAERHDKVPRVLLPGEAACLEGQCVVRTVDGAIRIIRARWEDAEGADLSLAELLAVVREEPTPLRSLDRPKKGVS